MSTNVLKYRIKEKLGKKEKKGEKRKRNKILDIHKEKMKENNEKKIKKKE